MKMLILNGPGLADLSGCEADPDISLKVIEAACTQLCATLGVDLDFRYTQDTQQLTAWLEENPEGYDALVLNPQGAQSAVSQADRQAIANALDNEVPAVEVHLDHILAAGKEGTGPLRPSKGNLGFICGLGMQSYLLAIKALHRQLQAQALQS